MFTSDTMNLDAILTADLIYAAGAAAVGGLVAGFSGFGAAIVMMPLFTLMWSPVHAVATCYILLLLTSIQMLPSAARHCDLRQMSLMGVVAAANVPLGNHLLVTVDAHIIQRTIGVVVMAYVLFASLGWRYEGRRPPVVTAGVGALSGLLHGATGMGGPPAILFLLAGPDSAITHRANLIAYLAFLTVAGIATLAVAGVIDATVLGRAAVVAPLYAFSIWFGTRLFRHANDVRYRRFALVLLLVIGVTALLR